MTKLLVLLLTLFAGITNLPAQDAVRKVTKTYFRSDPFTSEFSGFLKHLINDPTIRDKEIFQRSDTGMFYVHGYYSTHNPFFFKPKKMEVVLAETVLSYSDSLDFKDTVLLYQLVAYGEPSLQGIKDVKKEFEKINKQINKGFSSNNYQEKKSGDVVTAAWYNYFIVTHGVAPVTIMWGMTNTKDEAVINITIRLKSSYNQAVLAAPLLPGL